MKIKVENLAFSYDSKNNILQDISFEYDSNNILCILGSNGCGKSTLLKCIVNELQPQKGKIEIDGKPSMDYSQKEMAKKISYIPQSFYPTFPFPVIDVVMMGRTCHLGYLDSPSLEDRQLALSNMEYLGISHLQDKPCNQISGGERQLMMIATALTQQSQIMILDEPTSYLDFGNQYKFIETIRQLKQKGIGIIMTTHFPDQPLSLKSETLILKNGIILEKGNADKIIRKDILKSIYGIDCNILTIDGYKTCLPIKKL